MPKVRLIDKYGIPNVCLQLRHFLLKDCGKTLAVKE